LIAKIRRETGIVKRLFSKGARWRGAEHYFVASLP